LSDPGAFRPLGDAAERMIEADYSLEAVLPQMLKLYEDAANIRTGLEQMHDRAPSVSVEDRKSRPNKPKPATSPLMGKTAAIKSTDIVTGKAPPKGWSPFRG
jgi:hypothetical protein